MKDFNKYRRQLSEMSVFHVKAIELEDRSAFESATIKYLEKLKKVLLDNKGKYSLTNAPYDIEIKKDKSKGGFSYLIGKCSSFDGKEKTFKISFPSKENLGDIDGFEISINRKKVEGLSSKTTALAEGPSYAQAALRQAIEGKKGGGAGIVPDRFICPFCNKDMRKHPDYKVKQKNVSSDEENDNN